MKTILSLLAFVIIVTAVSCSRWSRPKQKHVDAISADYEGVDVGQLENGRRLFMDNCSLCHSHEYAAHEDAEELSHVVPVMAAKVNKKLGPNTIGEDEQMDILRYLVSINTVKGVKGGGHHDDDDDHEEGDGHDH